MKKLIAVVCALLLGASLSFAQTGGSTDTKAPKTASGKKATKTKSHAKKGGKKGSASSTKPPSPSEPGTNPPAPAKSGTNPPPPPPPK